MSGCRVHLAGALGPVARAGVPPLVGRRAAGALRAGQPRRLRHRYSTGAALAPRRAGEDRPPAGTDEHWHLPRQGAVTSHILKHPTEAFPELIENELFCTALARATGLDVAETGLIASDIRVFCSKRFDRLPTHDEGHSPLRKVHQEDFCQILRTEPDRKYECGFRPIVSTRSG